MRKRCLSRDSIFRYNSAIHVVSGKNKAEWFPVAFLVVFDTEFSFSWWAALPNMIHITPWVICSPLNWTHRLTTYSKPGYDVDLTGCDTPWAYILHGDRSLHSSCNPCQRTRSTNGGWFLGVHDTSVSIPHDTSSCLILTAGKLSKVSLMVLVNWACTMP